MSRGDWFGKYPKRDSTSMVAGRWLKLGGASITSNWVSLAPRGSRVQPFGTRTTMRKLSPSGSVRVAPVPGGNVQSPKGEADRIGVGPSVGLGVAVGVAVADSVAAAGVPVGLDTGGLLGIVAAVGFWRYPARVKAVAAATMKTPAAMPTPVSRGRPDHGSLPRLGCI